MNKINKRSAFTLIELLVVVAIIGVLSAMILGIAGIASRKSARSKTIATMGHIQNCLEEYRIVKNEYPGALNVMKGVVPEDVYALVTFTDSWGNAFVYQKSSRFSYKLYSKGADSRPEATSDDIVAQGSAQ
ncbi:MAG TPA: type II secretion system protein [Candidatus Hydrogenedentes bacterium]|nr:type II secretion system protein [Candidatus Hydrogenedentota bacterium]